jgi:hypothetical protein
MRLRCHVWGCSCAADYPACARCGAPLYGPGDEGRWWIDRGWYDGPLFDWWHWLWMLEVPRCLHCRRVLVFRRRYGWDGGFCSDKCADSWLPF